MPPKMPGIGENTNTYPDIVKLKEKYSPQKRIPPPSRGPSESFSKNYKVFATSPKRNRTTLTSKNINIIEMKNLSMNLGPPMGGSRNGSPELKSDDSVSSNGPKIQSSSGGLSPIRRSGSPVRRRHISEIEQEITDVSLKRKGDTNQRENTDDFAPVPRSMLEEPPTTKRQKVSFNQQVEYNDTFTTSSLNDESDQQATKMPGAKVRNYNNEGDNIVDTLQHDGGEKVYSTTKSHPMVKMNTFMDEINIRLESLENTQQELLRIICNCTTNPETINRINKLQESTTKFRNSLK